MKLTVVRSTAPAATVFTVRFGEKTFTCEISLPDLRVENYDFAVWPVLLAALRSGTPIEIEHPVTPDLSFNVGILQSYLQRHLGLAPVALHAPETAPPSTGFRPGTVLPFSGGVDSCFTLLFNRFELGRPIEAAAVVRGLDLFDEQEYALCRERCRPILALTGTELIEMRTDVRKQFVTALGWKLHSDFTLAGLLHFFHGRYGHAFISGEGDAGLLSVADCFRTPFLNERLFFLFGSDAMLIQNFEGANHTKVQKVEFIARFPEVRQNLRVCWKTQKHSNCGQCTKCVTTQLAFLAVTGAVPPCFSTPATREALDQVFRLVRETTADDPDSPRIILPKEFACIRQTAEKYGSRHPLLDALNESGL